MNVNIHNTSQFPGKTMYNKKLRENSKNDMYAKMQFFIHYRNVKGRGYG